MLGLDVNWIRLALEGRTGLLQAIFGKGGEEATAKPMTNERFRSFASRHNRRYERGKSRGGG